jgi:Ion channel
MIRQFLVGGAVSTVTIAMHALVMIVLIGVARSASARSKARPYEHLVLVMVPTVMVLMATHTAEVLVWALGYWLVDATPEGADRVYFAFVNFATLGYGDIVPVARWRILGPIAAMNGALLFGWSTAVIFEVMRRALRESERRARP